MEWKSVWYNKFDYNEQLKIPGFEEKKGVTQTEKMCNHGRTKPLQQDNNQIQAQDVTVEQMFKTLHIIEDFELKKNIYF